MIAGNLQFAGFSYGVGDGKNTEGKPIKILGFKSVETPAQFTYIFTPEEFDQFITTISASKIVIAHEMPNGPIAAS